MQPKEFAETFVRDASEHLSRIRRGALALEKGGYDLETVRDLLRRAHTLKGSASVLGLQSVGLEAHALEDLLTALSEGEEKVSPETIDLLLQSARDLEARIAEADASGEIVRNLEGIFHEIDAYRPHEPPRGAAAQSGGGGEEGRETVRARVDRLDALVNSLGELLSAGDAMRLHRNDLGRLTARFDAFVSTLRGLDAHREAKLLGEELQRLAAQIDDDLDHQHRQTQAVHAGAMELRMLPLESITGDLPLLTRDLCREQGKEVELHIDGEEVELDRSVLEVLRPMLIHMLRNAVDHGIEPPSERAALGKPPSGRVAIEARYEGGMVLVSMKDDGRGIDPAEVRRRALRQGVITEEEARTLGDEESLYLILRPGFTTREIVTDVSGRGVGMDVVKNSLERIKGNLIVHSSAGQGTEIVLHLPLTLAVVPGLLIDCEGEIFAIPLHYVAEVVRLSEADLLTEGGREVIRHGAKLVPLVALRDILNIAPRRHASLPEKLTALLLHFRGQSLACTVTASLGARELLVKGTGSQLKRMRFFAGATPLSGGTPALILSVADLFDARFESRGSGLRRALAEKRERSARGRVLVVDDSIITRTLEKNILEAHGYEVQVAINGAEALSKAQGGRFDLVVTDIEMPEMDGFELTRQLRRRKETAEIPVAIVSSRASDDDRRKGIEVGAQAYIVKGSFDQGKLLATVETLIG